MKATEQYFPVVLFIMLYKVVATFWVCWWNPKVWPFKWKLLSSTSLWCCLLCCTRWLQLFESVDEILKCDHSNESYWAVLPCGAVYYAVQGGSNFWVCWWNPKVWPFKWKPPSLSTFLWCCFCCGNVLILDGLFWVSRNRSNESYFSVALGDTCAVQDIFKMEIIIL